MIKTLRITSVIAVLMAMAIFALPVMYGVKTDQNIENFLNGPGVTDVFKATLGSRPAAPVNQVHPLVQQAEAFALILNPPPPPVKSNPKTASGGRPAAPTPPKVTPKFTLKSTIFYEQNPELSLALIQEGKLTRWVMQSSTVNHLLIEQIKDGLVIVRNGEETFELKTPEKNFTSPSILDVPDRGRITSPTPTNKSIPERGTPSRPPRTLPVNSLKTTVAPRTEAEEERMAQVEELYERLKIINDASKENPDGSPSTMEDKAVQMQKIISEFKNANMNISGEESQRLDDLGNYLEYIQDTSEEN
ncbi:MAG: hypothetical protein JXA96_12020 [Sedimentisphaerales bacterium]|nr:hypothetical protein [Sedimentisphaerales bacterium]